MSSVINMAIQAVNESQVSYCKFIQHNDTKASKAHQAGFHLHKSSYSLFFEKPQEKGTQEHKFITIRWQGDDSFETSSRFIYYGRKTRDEYRLTRLGKNFPFREEENVGDLLVLAKVSDTYYDAFVLSSDDDIEAFLDAFGLTPSDVNQIIDTSFDAVGVVEEEPTLLQLLSKLAKSLKDFPSSTVMSSSSRGVYNQFYQVSKENLQSNPDLFIVDWIDSEFTLFKLLEVHKYGNRIKTPFDSVEELVKFANTILNRRKSRAGKSLENHLEEIFKVSGLPYSAQAKTELNKKPDFIFPSERAYHDKSFVSSKLVFLGAKTTCKDRWRQILNEANRIEVKHLFTLQPGISAKQLKEMKGENVKLVTPKGNINAFPPEVRKELMNLAQFIKFTRARVS